MTAAYQNEIAVIGSVLLKPDIYPMVCSKLRADDFGTDATKAAFMAIQSVTSAGDPLDPSPIAVQLVRNGMMEADAVCLLRDCMLSTPTAENAEQYCNLVKEQSRLRRLVNLSNKISESAQFMSSSVDIAASVQSMLDEMRDDAAGQTESGKQMCDALLNHFELAEKDPGYAYCKTGFPSLDRMLGGGLVKNGMYIVGARPGMGKTTLGIAIAERVVEMGKKVLFVSMEMTDIQIMSKRVAITSRVGYTKLVTGQMNEYERIAAENGARWLSDKPFILSCKERMTVAEICALCQQIDDLSLIVVDYLGLIKPADADIGGSRYEQFTNISADIKSMSKRIGVPTLVLCQLNRQNTARSDKKPQLSDLRDTGAIEQDADGAILLHRESYYKPEEEKTEEETIELIVAKNRHGSTGAVNMRWHNSTGLIAELEGGKPDAGYCGATM